VNKKRERKNSREDTVAVSAEAAASRPAS